MGSLPNCASYCHKYKFANAICRRGRSNEMIQCSTVAAVPLKILPRFEKGEPRSKLEHFKLFNVHLNVSNSWPEVDWRSFHVKFPPPSCWRGRAIVGFSSTTLPLQLAPGKGSCAEEQKEHRCNHRKHRSRTKRSYCCK